MIEHLQMMQRTQIEDIERIVVARRRFPQAQQPKTRLTWLWNVITSIF
jgi:hypothetical protein